MKSYLKLLSLSRGLWKRVRQRFSRKSKKSKVKRIRPNIYEWEVVPEDVIMMIGNMDRKTPIDIYSIKKVVNIKESENGNRRKG